MTSGMTKEEALQFLRDHQPMPGELELDENTISTFEDVRKYFLANPDKACIPLFLGAFAPDTGLGVYQMVEMVFRKFEPVDVIPHLITALRSERLGTRTWSAEIASGFPSPDLIRPLSEVLSNGDFDLRYAAITALEQIKDSRITDVLRAALEREEEEEIRNLIAEVLGHQAP